MRSKKHYSREIFEPIVKSSKTYKECLEKLGLDIHGGNYTTIKHWIKVYQLAIDHFESDKERMKNMISYNKLTKIPLEDILVPDSTYGRNHLKKRLYDTKLKKRECEMCKQGEKWFGKKMSLILDHINGINNDNTISNLRILCPNCAATLDTHAGKNNKKIVTYCTTCNENEIWKSSKLCVRCLGIKRRRSDRPSFELLQSQINNLGYRGTSKLYGITDSTIRNWLNWYIKYESKAS